MSPRPNRPSSIHPAGWVIAFLSHSIWSSLNIFTAEQCIQRTRSKCCRIDSSTLSKRHCSKASLIIGVWTNRDEYLGNNRSTALLWQPCTFFSVFPPLFILTNSQLCVACKWSVINRTLKCQVLGKGQGRVFRPEPGATSWPQMARLSFPLDFQGQLGSMPLPIRPHGNAGITNKLLSTCLWGSLKKAL